MGVLTAPPYWKMLAFQSNSLRPCPDCTWSGKGEASLKEDSALDHAQTVVLQTPAVCMVFRTQNTELGAHSGLLETGHRPDSWPMDARERGRDQNFVSSHLSAAILAWAC